MFTFEDAFDGAVLVRMETFDARGELIVRCELRGKGITDMRAEYPRIVKCLSSQAIRPLPDPETDR